MDTRTGWKLASIVLVYCVLGTTYSLAVPLFEAPDEIWHFSFIRVLADERALPVQPTEDKDLWLRESGQPPLYHLVAAPIVAQLDTSDFPGFVRFNSAHPAITAHSESDAPNVFIHTPHEAFPYRDSILAVHLVRLLGVLWGAGTIVGVYLVSREVLPGRPGLALAAASLTALNPHFVYISSVVNNDVAAACTSTLALWLAIRLARGKVGGRSIAALGVLLGLSLLAKLSTLALLPLVVLALGMRWWRERDARALLVRAGAIFGLTAAISGWWYVRNWLLYGDPLGWSVWLIDIGVQRIGPAELLRQMGHVWTSFWSPEDGLFPGAVFWALGLLLAAAALGWGRLAIRLRRGVKTGPRADGLLLAGIWFLLLFGSLLRYMMTTPSAEGRLLYPGVASVALLLVVGWDTVVPRRWGATAAGVVLAGLLALSAWCPLYAIAPRYAPPLVAPDDELAGMTVWNATWGDVKLLGLEVEPKMVAPGGEVRVTLYWEARGTLPADLRAVVRLWTMDGQLLGQRDTTPAGEVYPPDLWVEGDVVRDVYRLPARGYGPAMCYVSVEAREGDRVLGTVSSPAMIRLAAGSSAVDEIAHPLAYSLDDKVVLAGYDVSVEGAPPGSAAVVTLYWRVTAEIKEDYTVFVHLLDPEGNLVGQGDGVPLDGRYPTSGWAPGEVLVDTHAVVANTTVAGSTLPDGAYLLVGLYRQRDGVRLPARTAAGERVPGDAIRLDVGRAALIDRE